jgi:nucleotidyltransferase substrate binding protein (TIGR01987 family)
MAYHPESRGARPTLVHCVLFGVMDCGIAVSTSKLQCVTDNPDIRWKQRFQNFDRACNLLHDALKNGTEGMSLLEKEGAIQRFEYSFELAWKTVRDFLEAGGVILSTISPRQVLKDAFAAKIIPDGQVWIDMLDHRNLLSHTYDSSVFEEAVDAIADRYLPAMQVLPGFLSSKSRT